MKQFAFIFFIIVIIPSGIISGIQQDIICQSAQNINNNTESGGTLIIGSKSRHSAIDLAGTELAKFLGMMAGDKNAATFIINLREEKPVQIEIGLFGDFDIAVDGVDDPTLDDAIYIDVRNSKGIITGSNPRSVLFAAYRFLEANGCRWIRPGRNGD